LNTHCCPRYITDFLNARVAATVHWCTKATVSATVSFHNPRAARARFLITKTKQKDKENIFLLYVKSAYKMKAETTGIRAVSPEFCKYECRVIR
jgi:hypothetical protein